MGDSRTAPKKQNGAGAEDRVLLADFGSTWLKYAVYSAARDEILTGGRTAFPQDIPHRGDHISEVSREEIDTLIFRMAAYAAEHGCKRIYTSVQIHGYLLKGQTGFSDYISWRDKRALLNGGYERFPHEKVDFTLLGSGYKVRLPLVALYGADLAGKEFFTLGSYIAYRLTGVNKTHITDAAASGFYNADTAEVVNPLRYPLIFPQSAREVEPVGKCGDAVVYTPAGDHQVTFLGLDIAPGEVLLNVSTATQMSTVSDRRGNAYECRPFFSGGRLCTVCGLIGGEQIRKRQPNGDLPSPALVRELAENYGQAFSAMPNDGRLVIGGGAAAYYRNTLCAAAEQIGAPYRITDTISSFAGLIRIVKKRTGARNNDP